MLEKWGGDDGCRSGDDNKCGEWGGRGDGNKQWWESEWGAATVAVAAIADSSPVVIGVNSWPFVTYKKGSFWSQTHVFLGCKILWEEKGNSKLHRY